MFPLFAAAASFVKSSDEVMETQTLVGAEALAQVTPESVDM